MTDIEKNYKESQEQLLKERKLIYAGVDMTNWNFDFNKDDDTFIYKAFIAMCNYAEVFIPCGKCPLYGVLCCTDKKQAEEFWNLVYSKLENVEP